jgi:hypothetical protein
VERQASIFFVKRLPGDRTIFDKVLDKIREQTGELRPESTDGSNDSVPRSSNPRSSNRRSSNSQMHSAKMAAERTSLHAHPALHNRLDAIIRF